MAPVFYLGLPEYEGDQMSLEHSPAKQRRISDRHLTVDDQKVLTFRQWCALNSISIATGKRILRSGDGPTVVHLSDRRIGIRVIDNAIWQQRIATS
jgi:hypothetical protein